MIILMVDDEPRGVETYKDELEAELDCKVVYRRKVDEALHFVRENLAGLGLLILGMMTPAGETFRHEKATEFGLRTGISFFEQVRRMAPVLPVIILTNVSDPKVLDRFRGEANCLYLQKKDYLPDQLVEE